MFCLAHSVSWMLVMTVCPSHNNADIHTWTYTQLHTHKDSYTPIQRWRHTHTHSYEHINRHTYRPAYGSLPVTHSSTLHYQNTIHKHALHITSAVSVAHPIVSGFFLFSIFIIFVALNTALYTHYIKGDRHPVGDRERRNTPPPRWRWRDPALYTSYTPVASWGLSPSKNMCFVLWSNIKLSK